MLVCAPAGFGKTALLADWARRGQRPVAWLSLDAGDNDPARFWRHVVAALDRVRPGIAERVGPLLGPPAPAVVRGAGDGADQRAGRRVRCGRAAAGARRLPPDRLRRPVHASLGFLLEHRPPGLHLVLASRSRPAAAAGAAAGPRAAGRAARRRPAVHRGRGGGAAAARRPARTALPEASVAALAARTEGWAAGLQLAALSLRGQRRRRRVRGRVHRQPPLRPGLPGRGGARAPARRRYATFLLETSVLDRLSRPAVRRRHRPAPTARRCWSRSSGPTCSWCRWTRCAAGGATTTCSPTCSAPACRRNSPAAVGAAAPERGRLARGARTGRRRDPARAGRRGDDLGRPADRAALR